MMKIRSWQWGIICILCLLIGGLLGRLTKQATSEVAVPVVKASRIAGRQPVVFVPGSGGNVASFDPTLARIGGQQNNVLKVTVKTNGQLETSGSFAKKASRPVIVIGFENSADGDQNVFRQTAWFKTAIIHLSRQYGFHHFQGVGYSNGGLVLTRYAEQALKGPALLRLVTLGTPYNDLNQQIADESPMLADLKSRRDQLSAKMTVYSINGTVNATDDGVVPASSVAAGRLIFKKQIKKERYTAIGISGDNAAHGKLPNNTTVIALLKQLLF